MNVRYNGTFYKEHLSNVGKTSNIRVDSVPVIFKDGFEVEETFESITLFDVFRSFDIENGEGMFSDSHKKKVWAFDKVLGWENPVENGVFEYDAEGQLNFIEDSYRLSEEKGEGIVSLFEKVTGFLNPHLFKKIAASECYLFLAPLALKNYWNIIQSQATADSAEKVISAMGANYFFENINYSPSGLGIDNAGKKVRQILGLPDAVIAFIKSHKALQQSTADFKVICMDDSNEGVFLVEYANTLAQLKTFKNDEIDDTSSFPRLVKTLAQIKSMYPEIKIPKLLRYLIKQKFYFGFNQFPPINWGTRDAIRSSFLPPTEEAREYFDYISMGKPNDFYPRNIVEAHNIATRNSRIANDPELAENFENAVSKLAEFTFVGKHYLVTYPKNLVELVAEGNALEHCVASYAKGIAAGTSRVFCIRETTAPEEPFVTLEVDENFETMQCKCKYDIDVTDKNVLEFIYRWAKAQRKEV